MMEREEREGRGEGGNVGRSYTENRMTEGGRREENDDEAYLCG